MASAATWSLASPSALVDGRAPASRQPPPAPQYVGLPPQSRLKRAVPSCRRNARSIVAMAGGESIRTTTTVAATSGEVPGEDAIELPEFVKTAQKAWEKVDDKYAVASIAVAGVIALWASTGVISAIDRLPLVPGVLELVGIGYTGWFVYQNLVFKPDREALIEKVKCTYNDIIGSS